MRCRVALQEQGLAFAVHPDPAIPEQVREAVGRQAREEGQGVQAGDFLGAEIHGRSQRLPEFGASMPQVAAFPRSRCRGRLSAPPGCAMGSRRNENYTPGYTPGETEDADP